jgi:hypothetical protein
MRWAGLTLIVALSLGAGPATQPAAKKRAPGAERTLHAMVAGVEGRVLKVSVLRKKAELKERRIRVGRSAVITLNRQPASLSSLKAGENVTIKLSHGVATHIDATGK